MYIKGQMLAKVVKQAAQIEDHAIPAGARGKLKLRIFRPEASSARLPVVMYFHGGGWVLGDADTYDYYMRELTNGCGAAVVFVEDSRWPEVRDPVGAAECYADTHRGGEPGGELPRT